MSRYLPSDYRPRDRSRSPPRFADRRPSAASIYDNRPPGAQRNASDAPRGPRSQFDGPRAPPPGGLGSGSAPRPAYNALRDAPPLGSGDRGRSYRDRQYDRNPSPRERSPVGRPKDSRDYSAPRDLDIDRARRDPRDGPPSAGSNYSEGPPPRGGFARGRGRGDFSTRAGRGGRGAFDDRERDLFRRERSPSKGWGRDVSRDSREPERRDDRRYDRRDDDRRPSDWSDRERERELDRNRRDPPPPRLETRPSSESVGSVNAPYQSSQAPPINPARLAMIEGTTADAPARRQSVQQDAPPSRREQVETPSYLNGRAETTANRYNSRGSSPPTQAPPVPAFTLSFAPPTSSSAPSQPAKTSQESQAAAPPTRPNEDSGKPAEEQRPAPPPEAPTAPRIPPAAPAAPKAQLASPPPAAPRGPRAHETDDIAGAGNRLQGVKSLENLPGQNARPEAMRQAPRPSSSHTSPGRAAALPTLAQPVSPNIMQSARPADLGAPTGPRAARASPAQPSVSPRQPYVSPRQDFGGGQGASGPPRMQTPPPTAPTGPRNQSYSISPQAAPTAPKGNRGPPLAPRGAADRGPAPPGRGHDRLEAPPWAPPSAPRSLQWNQWKRPGPPPYGDKSVPAKRDFAGEEIKPEDGPRPAGDAMRSQRQSRDETSVAQQPPMRQMSGHSATRSFFGQPKHKEEDEDTAMAEAQDVPSTSDEDDSDSEDENLTLFHAKFERQKRHLEAQMADLRQPRYRATTPLESIARLARVSVRDLQRVNEARDREMDVDDSPVIHNQHLLSRTGRSSDSGEGPDLLTPKAEEDHRVAIRGSDDSSESIRRVRRPTPEPVSLPYLVKDRRPSFDDSVMFEDGIKRYEDTKEDVLDEMARDWIVKKDMIEDIAQNFADEYRRWREECDELDRVKEDQIRAERQQSVEPGPELEVPAITPASVYEGRRLHKFSSEYEIEQVLKQSEETARLEQERQDREAKKNQADMEKEAIVPDQKTGDERRRSTFVDFNRYREPESLTTVFSYEPPADNFTDNEQQIFIAAFKETPKKWGEIASLLPGRTYEECIRHYYANKWDNRFRDNRTKKLKAGGRRGRGGGRGPRGRIGGLMADLARAEEFLSPDNMSEKGRPRRAAAPTTFAEKEAEAKASLLGPSPTKKGAANPANGEVGAEKPKRQKRTGDKPGRRGNKAHQPLAALAPQASPGKQFLQGMSKEDATRAQRLEEANLLTNLQSGHHGIMKADGQMVYSQDGFIQSMGGGPEEPERSKPAGQAPPPKQSASSYWSVPEQNDFVKYIGHFGRDFGAIAAHMGTKTQTMIKNHYQRQVEGGNRPELERTALEAEERRARGEDLGPAPTPTPIVKRKYDNPQPVPQRSIAPHSEAMDVDDTGPTPRAAGSKHASPPQFQTQPRITSSSQNTAISAPRVAPSPLATSVTPASSQASGRPLQAPLGSRITFLPDSCSDMRQGAQPAPGFRAPQESLPRSQPSQQARSVADGPDRGGPHSEYINGLIQEQERALRMQDQYNQPEQAQRQNLLQRNQSQGSPLSQSLHNPPERKPLVEERPQSPARNPFPGSTFSRSTLGSSSYGPLGPPPMSSLPGRSPFNHSSPKREEPRPTAAPAAPATPAEPPKRSNVMSLLNNDDDVKTASRESAPPPAQKPQSPAPQTYPYSTSAASPANAPGLSRRPSFGHPSMPHSHFSRTPYPQPSPTPAPPNIKHEPHSGGGSASHTPKPDWAARVLGQSSQQGPAGPTLEREMRPYYQGNHRSSMLGSLNQPRANPSPPPLGGVAHSRTPSLTAQPGPQSREQNRPGVPGPQSPAPHPSAQPHHANPYGQPHSQQQSGPPPGQAHHSHNSSVSAQYPGMHHRAMSRDDRARHEHNMAAQRDCEEQEMRWRQREEERYMVQHRQQEQERQQGYRHPPQSLQPPQYAGGQFSQNRSLDLREQSRMETEMALREEQDRAQRIQDSDRRRQDAMMREREQEDYRRRQQQEEMYRRTPLGGGYGAPPPGPRR